MSRLQTTALALALSVPGAFLTSAGAQSAGGPYAIDPAADAGGGGATLSGGQFRLNGTVGQPAASPLAASGYQLDGGFHPLLGDRIFASGFDQ